MSFDNYIYANFNLELNKIIKKINEKKYSNLIFICIGTNKIVGDSLGPIVGEILKQNLKKKNVSIIGDLKENVNIKNISKYIKYIENNYTKPYIISIDSALSKTIAPENVFIIKKGLIPGSALKKESKEIGNISIKGIVGRYDKNSLKNFYNLKTVDYKLILRFSKNISKIILKSIKFLNL